MKRLVEGSVSPRAAALLRAAASEAPTRSAEAKARILSTVAATPRQAPRGFRAGKWSGMLLMVVGAIGILGGVHAFAPSSPGASEKSVPAIAANAPAAAVEMANGPTVVAEAPMASIDVTALPSAPSVAAAPRIERRLQGAASAAPGAQQGTPTLEDELRAVDVTRASFVERQPALTLERVQAYRRRFPKGNFQDEIDALEIQALAALGRTDEAQSKATRFLAERPASPYAQRVRSAVFVKP
ncbi:hypothetical protein AKJ09_01513 [Labilithrix luteola]|uniref:Uncharacterized protein n=1 Tax=Labilithrix luteola TaxID=1391654 RepID=A0A0K1PP06_9BACT|nr:hypothetical protein [Labilithrix luteola]AKU94849.1 hypothetical protein AKJ09_01513 [Labilithrix luteola]